MFYIILYLTSIIQESTVVVKSKFFKKIINSYFCFKGSVSSACRRRIWSCQREPGGLQSVRSEASSNKVRRGRPSGHENNPRCTTTLHPKPSTANHFGRFSGKFIFYQFFCVPTILHELEKYFFCLDFNG